MWKAKEKNKMQLPSKYKIYTTKEVEEKPLRVMQSEAKVYNKLLDVVNRARKEGKKITPRDTHSMLKDLKIKGKELVYFKELQMVNDQLWYNINALHDLKRKGKKGGN
jgi:putative transposase